MVFLQRFNQLMAFGNDLFFKNVSSLPATVMNLTFQYLQSHHLLLHEKQETTTLYMFMFSFPHHMQFIIKTQHKTISVLIKRLIDNSSPLSLFFLNLQWKNMNYSTAWWTCAELQRIWRLASDRKWGISHQNTLFKRLVRLMSHYYSHVLPIKGFCRVCFSGLRSKAVGFPAVRPCSDR